MEKTLIIVEFTAKAKKQDICDGAGEGGGEVEIYLLWILSYSIQEKKSSFGLFWVLFIEWEFSCFPFSVSLPKSL